MHGDIYRCVICMQILTPCDMHADFLPLCDMRGDIDHNVTLTAMRHVLRHLPLCDMYGDVHHHVICAETFTSV